MADEKGGIIKQDGVAIVYDQSEEAKNVIKQICYDKNAKYIEVKFDDINIKKSDIYSQVYDATILNRKYEDLEIKLIGEHQINNSILALSVIKYLEKNKALKIDDKSIRKGLINAKWPGRIEKISENPVFIIDGAHDEDGNSSQAR